MKRVSTTLLISLSLASVVISAVFIANALGLFPDRNQAKAEVRVSLCEAIALNCSHAVKFKNHDMLRETLDLAVSRNEDIVAAQLVRRDGKSMGHIGDLTSLDSDLAQVATVPILADGRQWGSVKIAFAKPSSSLLSLIMSPIVRFALALGALCGLAFQFYLRRILQHLDPSTVVPDRVRTTLDTLAEGLVVLDTGHRIVLANEAFADTMGLAAEELQGVQLDEFSWKQPNTSIAPTRLPWGECISNQAVVSGAVLQLDSMDRKDRKFRITCSPVMNNGSDCQGALVSFDDVTALEARTVELTSMLEKLKSSRDKIRKQNQQLITLATTDALTGALNRRSVLERLDEHWARYQSAQTPLSCIMVDIDHFKSVNDNHGHAMGDLVLKRTVTLFNSTVRATDIVGRLGGEEFCVICPGSKLDRAMRLAEQIREAFEQADFEGLKVTASFGVAEVEQDASGPADLLDWADKSLYVAKRTGRNRVISYPELEHIEDIEIVDDSTRGGEPTAKAIPFQTVAALTAALAYRDVATAQHSRRVADHCFNLGSTMMSLSEAYILENAALLHDIGKIGVPDCILLKPGSLTEEEWEVMRRHDDIGVGIINSTFACEQLTEIVEHHHTRYSGDDTSIRGKEIPLGARILSISDSYDAMTSDRVYRKGLTQEYAFEELRRCAGGQFDPDLVEAFICMIEDQTESVSEPNRTVLSQANKHAALHLGILIEELAQALDEKNRKRLVVIARSIWETADKYEVTDVARLAEALADSAGSDEDWNDNLELTIELMELCRLTQQTHIQVESPTVADVKSLASA